MTTYSQDRMEKLYIVGVECCRVWLWIIPNDNHFISSTRNNKIFVFVFLYKKKKIEEDYLFIYMRFCICFQTYF